MKNPLRILHVEDSPKDSELVEATLQQEGIACDVLRVQTRADYVSALEQSRFDLILGDYTMPGFDGLTALKIAHEKRPDVPFIFVSGTLGEDVAIEALKHGAVDYVLKDRLSRLVPCVRRALREVEEQRERKLAQEALRESEARKQAMLEGALDAIIAIDHQGKILEFNPAAERTFGYTLDQVIGKPLADLIIPPHLREKHKQGLKQYIATGEGPFIGKVVEVTAMRADGTELPTELAITSIGEKWPPMFLGHVRNITERKRAEKERLRLISVIEAATDLVGIADPQGRALYINKNGRKMVGIGEDEDISGLLVTETHPEPARKFVLEEAIPTAIREGVWSGENALLTRDGREIPVLQVILAHRAPDGSVEFLSTIIRDITERKRAEGQIRLNLERIRALREIDLAISSTLDLPSVFSILLEKVELFLPCPAALSVRLLNKETGLLEPVAVRNMAKEEWIAYMRGIPEPRKSFGSMAMEAKAPIIVRNIQTDPRTQLPEFYRRHGLVSCFFIPLIAKEEPVGTLCIFAKGEYDFTEEEIEFLTTLAGQAAIAIHNSQLYEEMAKLAGDLAKSTRVKDEFLSVMSHELRTPLNVVVGYTGMIKDGLLGEVNPQQAEALEKVINRANDQLSLVNNILYATVLEVEKINVDIHEVSLRDFLGQLKLSYEAPINKELTLNWELASDLPVIRTDSAKLKQILQNLIDNAIKFTDKGSVTISAWFLPVADSPVPRRGEGVNRRNGESGKEGSPIPPIAVSPVREVGGRQEYVELKVADTGIGISKQAQSIIFEKFRQLDSSETRLYGGVGLGLYIVKKLTELLGGNVDVESEPGRGSAFTVRIPCS